MLLTYANMLSRDEEYCYRCDQVRHRIVLKPGRFPPMTRVAVRVMVNFNVPEKGLIKESPQASSITFVKNAQGRVVAVRVLICGEFRTALQFHIAGIRHKYFHSWDLIPGYHFIILM